MSQSLILKALGLKTAPNQLSAVGPGSMTTADNVVIDQPGVITPRRGIYSIRTSSSPYAERTLFSAAKSATFFNDELLIHCADNALARWSDTAAATYYNTAGVPTVHASATIFTPPTGFKTRFEEGNGNLLFTTSTGVRKLDTTNSVVRYAGYPASINFSTAATAAATGWLNNSESVAYRVVFGYTDANQNLILNNPARSRSVLVAPAAGGPFNVTLTVPFPDAVAVGDIYQVYRSFTAASGETAGDELGLVYEGKATAAQVTARQVSVVDIVPQAFIGASLYTNSSQDGQLAGNDSPPMARDMALFNNSMVYANLTEPHRYYLTLLATGFALGTKGITASNSIRVAGQDYLMLAKGATANVPASFANNISYVDEVSLDPLARIEYTAQTLCNQINKNPNNTSIYAYYISSQDDLPGRMIFEERHPGGSAFSVNAHVEQYQGKSAPFDQSLPVRVLFGNTEWSSGAGAYGIERVAGVVTVTMACDVYTELGTQITLSGLTGDTDFDGTFTITAVLGTNSFQYNDARANNSSYNSLKNGVAAKHIYAFYAPGTDLNASASTAESSPHGLAISRLQQSEAVPLTNRLFVGGRSDILRIVPLRDRLFIFKEDGIWSMTGDNPSNYRIDLLDGTAEILAPETAVVLGNRIFALTNQGVVAISGDSGVQIISRDIETDLLQILGATGYSTMANLAWAVSYETERKYILHLPTSSSAVNGDMAYVYNLFTNTWTTQSTSFACGAVAPTADVLYYAGAPSGVGVDTRVYRERKSFTFLDYADNAYPIDPLSSTSFADRTFTASGFTPEPGDIFYNNGQFGIIATVDPSGFVESVVTLSSTGNIPSLGITGSWVFKSIHLGVTWCVDSAGNPGVLKQYSAAKVFLGECERFSSLDIWFGNELVGYAGAITLTPPANGHYPVALPTYVPRSAQRCSLMQVGLTQAVAWDWPQINGVGLVFNPGSERFTR